MKIPRLLRFAALCAMVGAVSTCGGGGNASAAAASTPWVAVTPTSLSFGSVSMGTSSAAQTISVTNSGTATLTVSSIAVDNSAFVLSIPALPVSLSPAQSFQIRVTFKPSTASSASGWLSISSNTTNSPNSLALSGTGVTSPPQISVGPSSLGFGSQIVGATSAAQALTVTNTGIVNATISSITLNSAGFR
jgi:hypothetical protein